MGARRGKQDKAARTATVQRRTRVAQMYLSGVTQDAIARGVGVSQMTVSNDLAALREEWKEQALGAFDERLATELRRIDKVEEEAWKGWERSCKDQVVTTNRTDTVPIRSVEEDDPIDDTVSGRRDERVRAKMTTPVGTKATMMVLRATEEKQRKGQVGDPRFLDKVAWCIDTRLRILGAYKEQKQQTTVVQINFDAMTDRDAIGGSDDPLEAKIAAIQQGAAKNPVAVEPHAGIPNDVVNAGAPLASSQEKEPADDE